MKYKFLGQADKVFPNLKKGKVYNLDVTFHPIGRFLHGVAVQIHKPISCPYNSEYSFYQNWRKI